MERAPWAGPGCRRRDVHLLGRSRAMGADLTSSDVEVLVAEHVSSEEVYHAHD